MGETHRSLLDRALEHEAAVRSGTEGNAMARHAIEFHPEMEEEKPVFTYEVIRSYKTSLARQLDEALLIEREECTTIMNTKGEWGINLVPRLVTEDNSGFLKQKPEDKSSTSAKRPPPESREVSHFENQFKQRKKRKKLAQDDNETQSNDSSSTCEQKARNDNIPMVLSTAREQVPLEKKETDDLNCPSISGAAMLGATRLSFDPDRSKLKPTGEVKPGPHAS